MSSLGALFGRKKAAPSAGDWRAHFSSEFGPCARCCRPFTSKEDAKAFKEETERSLTLIEDELVIRRVPIIKSGKKLDGWGVYTNGPVLAMDKILDDPELEKLNNITKAMGVLHQHLSLFNPNNGRFEIKVEEGESGKNRQARAQLVRESLIALGCPVELIKADWEEDAVLIDRNNRTIVSYHEGYGSYFDVPRGCVQKIRKALELGESYPQQQDRGHAETDQNRKLKNVERENGIISIGGGYERNSY